MLFSKQEGIIRRFIPSCRNFDMLKMMCIYKAENEYRENFDEYVRILRNVKLLFAKKYSLPVNQVVSKKGEKIEKFDEAFTDAGVLVNSGKFDGLIYPDDIIYTLLPSE